MVHIYMQCHGHGVALVISDRVDNMARSDASFRKSACWRRCWLLESACRRREEESKRMEAAREDRSAEPLRWRVLCSISIRSLWWASSPWAIWRHGDVAAATSQDAGPSPNTTEGLRKKGPNSLPDCRLQILELRPRVYSTR